MTLKFLSHLCLIILFFSSCTKQNNIPQKVHLSPLKKIWYNFHAVEPGVLYRSGQLSPRDLEKVIQKYHLKTVINLRGVNKNCRWWQREERIAQKYQVAFYNIPMNAQRMPLEEDLLTLLTLYEKAARPILIHCYSGADRTGEAAALWVLEQQKKGKKQALKQLTLKYGYLQMTHPLKRRFIKEWQGKNDFYANPSRNS